MPSRAAPDSAMFRVDATTAALLAVVSCAIAALAKTSGVLLVDAPIWAALLVSIAVAGPLAFRRRWPVPIALVVTAVYIVGGELGALELYGSQVCLFLGFYSIGAWEADRRSARRWRIVIVVVMAVWLSTAAVRGFFEPETGERGVAAFFAILAIQVVVNAGYFGGGWVFGDRTYRSALERQELHEAHSEIRAQQDLLAEQAVSLERVRIARELHDVVAHHVSAMGVQAGAARRVLDRDPDAAKVALTRVEQSAREAIGELRSLVLTLRADDAEGTEAATIEQLDALVAAAREGGQSATLERIGELPAVSHAVSLTAFRVVQEALTNARKHAGPGAAVDVRLRGAPDALEIEVADDGRGAARRSAAAGTGTGLVGMRERVTAVGGTLEAGGKDRGGFLVRARLPASAPR